jgi:hypothetical protein
MMTISLGDHGKWVHCKHMYNILQNVMFCELMQMFIHRLAWTWDKVHKSTSPTIATKVKKLDL